MEEFSAYDTSFDLHKAVFVYQRVCCLQRMRRKHATPLQLTLTRDRNQQERAGLHRGLAEHATARRHRVKPQTQQFLTQKRPCTLNTGSERGSNFTHRILFIEQEHNMRWEHGWIALGRKCKWISSTPWLFGGTWTSVWADITSWSPKHALKGEERNKKNSELPQMCVHSFEYN